MTEARPTDVAGATRMVLSGPVCEIRAVNSRGFLQRVFDCYRDKRLFAICRDGVSLSDGTIAGADLVVEPLTLEDETPATAHGWLDLAHRPDLSPEPAQLVFTSGTERRPKAIVLSHRNLADVVLRLNEAMAVTDEIREYIGVPVTYSFGLGRARAVAAAGGRAYLPERFDPLEIRRMLEAGEINAVSAVPSLWRLVLANPDSIGKAGAQMRWIEIGSQYMSADDKRAMIRLFPNARIIQHYGLTEASRSTFLDLHGSPDSRLDSVGRATGHVGLRIEDDGAIAIRGDHVGLGMLEPDGTLAPLAGPDGWFKTRDRGRLDDGWLYFDGRMDDQINIAGVKLNAEWLESAIVALVPGTADGFAATAIADPQRGEAVLLAIEPTSAENAAAIEAAARLLLARRGITAPAALQVLRVDRLPRTDTNKIQRARLRDGAARPGAAGSATRDSAPPAPSLTEAEARVAAVWQRVMGGQPVAADRSFYDLGGDSLSSVEVGLAMEAADLPRPVIQATLSGRPLRETAALLGAESPEGPEVAAALPDQAAKSWAIGMTRGIMVLSVLMSHWGTGFFSRIGLGGITEGSLGLFYRMGTPGFAAVFGLGIGFYMLPDFEGRRALVMSRLRRSGVLVLVGLLLGAAVHLLITTARGGSITGLTLAHSFYGVLTYYAVMLLGAPLWLPALARLRHLELWLLACLPGMWILWQIAGSILPAQQSFAELPRLMLAAGYSLFKLTAVAAPAAAVGLWMRRQPADGATVRLLLTAGAITVALSLGTMIEANGLAGIADRRGVAFTSLPALTLYLGAAVLFAGLFLHLSTRWNRLPAALRMPAKALMVIGGLSLPIYVFHGLVIPVAELLRLSGLPGMLALVLPLAGFVLTVGWAAARLWRAYSD